jgi:hypothetical protein
VAAELLTRQILEVRAAILAILGPTPASDDAQP